MFYLVKWLASDIRVWGTVTVKTVTWCLCFSFGEGNGVRERAREESFRYTKTIHADLDGKGNLFKRF